MEESSLPQLIGGMADLLNALMEVRTQIFLPLGTGI